MSFSIHELIYKVNQETGGGFDSRQQKRGYSEVLTRIQMLISNNHGSELAEVLYTPAAEQKLKALIVRYLNAEKLAVDGIKSISELADKVYSDMAGIGIISTYLQDPTVEEINVNAHNSVWVQYKDHKERIPYAFNSPNDCVNIVKKMSRFGNVILDGSKPIGDSYLSKGIRMSGAIAPCVDDALGGVASVRVQKTSIITRENLVSWETATDDELNLLTLCVNHGISIAISGATGAGKTADMGFLLSQVKNSLRIVTIEDTYELKLAREDENGFAVNDVVSLLTKEAPNPVSMNDLLRLALRFHPNVLVPAEMRGAEALTVQEAGRTGHTIVSTVHANSAKEAYDRILTMCLMSGTNLSEGRLLKNIVDAFPIMVYKEQLPDMSRKYMEVFEATGIENGEVTGNMLFRFIVTGHEKDENGEVIRTLGYHKQTGFMSQNMAERLFRRGVDPDEINKYTEYTPE